MKTNFTHQDYLLSKLNALSNRIDRTLMTRPEFEPILAPMKNDYQRVISGLQLKSKKMLSISKSKKKEIDIYAKAFESLLGHMGTTFENDDLSNDGADYSDGYNIENNDCFPLNLKPNKEWIKPT